MEYQGLIRKIGRWLEEGRKDAVRQVNNVMVQTYWLIGKELVEYEQKGVRRAKYGTKLLETVSRDLTEIYGRRFSVDNVENMRRFYLCFKNSETLSRKLSWSAYCLVMRLDNQLAREFYCIEASRENWSVRELERQINSMLFERIALSKDKKGILALARKRHILETPADLVKDPYVLDFLGLESHSKYSENMLEQRLIDHLKTLILELGKGFMFVERQKRITIEGEHFFVDLVFYNKIVNCFVLIELKVGKLTHKDLGQLQMYVHYFDRNVKTSKENLTVGLLLCADKKEAIVRYTLPDNNRQIFSSKYRLILPNRKELENKLRNLLESGEGHSNRQRSSP